jgi:hypothetical protein
MSLRNRCLVCLFAVGLTSSAVHADDLFSLTATGTSNTVTAGGSSVLNLVQNLSNNANQFSVLKNQNFSAAVNYVGINNAIVVNQSFDTSGNRVLNVQVPSVGLNKTFSSANGSLDTQIRDFLKKQGLAELADFQAQVDKNTFAGVMDGNPLAATSMIQDAGFQEFGLHTSPMDLAGNAFSTDGGHIVNRYWTDGGVLDAGGVSGQYVDLTIATEIHFNDIIGLTFTTPLRYEKLRSADIFMGGEVIGLPITIMPAKGGLFFWQVTPAIHGGAAGSQDFVSGGILYGAQATSSFGVHLGGFEVTLADQFGYYHGANVDIGGYHFNTNVDQAICKNGLQMSKSWGNFFLDGSGTWTNFLNDAYVKGYFTPEVGIGFKFGANNDCGLRVGYTGNFGNRYNTNGGDILLYFTR